MTQAFGGAAKAIDQACRLDPKNPRYPLWAGHIHTYDGIAKAHSAKTWLAVAGGIKRGAKYCERALAVDPNCHEARYLVHSLYDNNPWFLGGNKGSARNKLDNLGSKCASYLVAPD